MPHKRRPLPASLLAVLPAWFAAHVVVLTVALVIAPTRPGSVLFKWDSNWYILMAHRMAAGTPAYYTSGNLIHFFPLTSICAAALAFITRLPVSIALFALCWTFSLVFGALLYQLVLHETGTTTTARRAAALSQLAPGAYVLVMGYTEPLAGTLSVLYFLAVRHRWTGWAVAAGLLAGVSRPTGVLLCVVGLAEGARRLKAEPISARLLFTVVAQAAAPVVSLLCFLTYSRIYYHGWTLPFSQQVQAHNRAAIMNNPIESLADIANLPWGIELTILMLILISSSIWFSVAAARRLPLSYTLWCGLNVILALGAKDFSSLPRYLAATFPILIGGALIASDRRKWLLLAASGTTLMATFALLALDRSPLIVP